MPLHRCLGTLDQFELLSLRKHYQHSWIHPINGTFYSKCMFVLATVLFLVKSDAIVAKYEKLSIGPMRSRLLTPRRSHTCLVEGQNRSYSIYSE